MKTNEKKTLATIWSHLMFGVLLCAAFASAQSFESIDLNGMQPPKVEIRYPEETTREGSLVSVRITIPDGWHVNANIVADDFLKPSTLNIQARGIQFGDPQVVGDTVMEQIGFLCHKAFRVPQISRIDFANRRTGQLHTALLHIPKPHK